MTSATAPNHIDWRTFKANGFNLGSWICLETFMVPKFFKQHGNAHDEWTACEKFGAAGAPLDEHYKTCITKADFDTFAARASTSFVYLSTLLKSKFPAVRTITGLESTS